MTSIEIVHPDPETGGTRVVVDGVDLSTSIVGAEVRMVGPHPPIVTLEPHSAEDFRLCSERATLVIDERVLDLLRAQGWRGPDEADDDCYMGPPIQFPTLSADVEVQA
jgi:hypothetical protein